jgi:N-acetyl-1-D-myo-inositol-2-amino-2-deoxy-alpha-D-glucopyranoside deacetylase
MSVASKRILAVFAHPDDELSVGGTLARYVQENVHVTLVCATRGEAATIYAPPEYGATPENLAQVRTGELECCCRALGVQDLRWLDWPDGGVERIDRDAAVAAVVALVREVRPQVILTHPEHGGYPHPDHIAVHHIVLAAWQAAADAAYRPDLGAAHASAKLYGRVIPASFFAIAEGLRDYRVALNGQHLPFFATPDEEIGTVLDVAAWAERRAAGWECHRSQHNPKGMFSNLSDEARRAYASREFLQIIAHRLPAAPQHETDLFAGLESTIVAVSTEGDVVGAPASETEIVNGDASADLPTQDSNLPPLTQADAAALAPRLMAALRGRRTYLMIHEGYRRATPQADFALLLDGLMEDGHEAIVELSHHLRHLGRSPMAAGVNDKVLAQGANRKGTASKLNFLLVGATQTLQWLNEQRRSDDPPAMQALWQQLIDAESRHLQQIKAVLGQVELAGDEPEITRAAAAQGQPGGLAKPRLRRHQSARRSTGQSRQRAAARRPRSPRPKGSAKSQ